MSCTWTTVPMSGCFSMFQLLSIMGVQAPPPVDFGMDVPQSLFHFSASKYYPRAYKNPAGVYYSNVTLSQPFWGSMIAAAGAGPEPVPYKSLSHSKLSEALKFCLRDEVATAARCIGMNMSREDGVNQAVNSFYANLPVQNLFCDLLGDRPAVWAYKRKGKQYKVSGDAAEILARYAQIERGALKL